MNKKQGPGNFWKSTCTEVQGGRQKNKQYHPESENWDQEDNGGGSDDGFDDKEEAKKNKE